MDTCSRSSAAATADHGSAAAEYHVRVAAGCASADRVADMMRARHRRPAECAPTCASHKAPRARRRSVQHRLHVGRRAAITRRISLIAVCCSSALGQLGRALLDLALEARVGLAQLRRHRVELSGQRLPARRRSSPRSAGRARPRRCGARLPAACGSAAPCRAPGRARPAPRSRARRAAAAPVRKIDALSFAYTSAAGCSTNTFQSSGSIGAKDGQHRRARQVDRDHREHRRRPGWRAPP